MPIPARPWRRVGTHIVDAHGKPVCALQVSYSKDIRDLVELSEHIINAVNKFPEKAPDMCVVCRMNPVCPEEGYDTCDTCTERV